MLGDGFYKKPKKVERSVKSQVKEGSRQRKKMAREGEREREESERWQCPSPFVFHMDSSLSVGLSFTLPRSLTLSLSCPRSLFLFTLFSIWLFCLFHPRSICLRPSSRALHSSPSPHLRSAPFTLSFLSSPPLPVIYIFIFTHAFSHFSQNILNPLLKGRAEHLEGEVFF